MALLIESYDGKWPFWLNPRQSIILAVNTSQPVLDWANEVREVLLGLKKEAGQPSSEGPVHPTGLAVDVDYTARSLGSKIREARTNGYSQILVVGEEDVKSGQVSLGKQRMSPVEMRERMLGMAEAFE
jgi:threonyl-tRNA synthetase